MKTFTLFICLGLLVGCDGRTPQQQQAETRDANHQHSRELIDRSTIECSDGHQIRVATMWWSGNSAVAAVWPVVDDNGHPKKCVLKAVAPASPPQYEEVPQ